MCCQRSGYIIFHLDLIPLATGIDANSLLLDIAVGNEEEIEIQNIESNVAGYLLFALPKGIVKDIKGIEKIQVITKCPQGTFRFSLYRDGNQSHDR